MLASELDFALPPELIAQRPARPRESARLLHLRRATGELSHRTVGDFPALLRPDDLLVFNDSRVLRARLRGHKASSGRVEALLLRERELNIWEALLKPSARLKAASEITFSSRDGEHHVTARLLQRLSEGWLLHFQCAGDVRDLLPLVGEVPLPPYIAPPEGDIESDYQTVYARQTSEPGAALDSAAAPTAGLHFGPELLARLRERGVQSAFVTLGVGAGTFRPVQTTTLEAHVMHRESFEIPARTAQLVAAQKARGARVVAVGTTATRALEAASSDGELRAGPGATELFIRPGYRFRTVDALLTNFHLPRSSLLSMIAAFCEPNEGLTGLKIVRYAYAEAVRLRYRFFSWGDAMFIE